MPEWLAYLIALVIVFLLEQWGAMQQRHASRPASRRVGRPALPRGSAASPTALVRSRSDNAAARTRRGQDAAPERPDLSRMRAELLEKLRQSDVDPAVLSQLAALGIGPSPIDPQTAATTAAPMPARLCMAKIRRDPRRLAPAGPRHRVSPAAWRRMLTRLGTGPPTGPPAISGYPSFYA
ncbi:MAG TPA: hypothetical protein VGG99_01915 [Acetobacteraceae bacterium]